MLARAHQKLAERAAGPASDTPTQTPVGFNTEAYRSSSMTPRRALHTTPAIIFCASPKGRASGPEVRGPKAEYRWDQSRDINVGIPINIYLLKEKVVALDL